MQDIYTQWRDMYAKDKSSAMVGLAYAAGIHSRTPATSNEFFTTAINFIEGQEVAA